MGFKKGLIKPLPDGRVWSVSTRRPGVMREGESHADGVGEVFLAFGSVPLAMA